VLSKGGGVVGTMAPIFKLFLGARLGNGRQYVPWIGVDDAVAAIRFLLDGGPGSVPVDGPVNITAPNPVTNKEFTRALGRALHKPAPWAVPRPLMRAALGEYADGLFISQRVAPTVLTRSGFEFSHRSVQEALPAILDR
jgi:uncharacterized protein